MPVGYLVSSVLVAWCTACALAPPRRPPVAAWASFLCGFMLNELPWVGMYYLIAATVLALASGDITSVGGWVACGLVAVTMGGLVVIALRGARAGSAVDRALTDGLGAGWRDAPAAESRARSRPIFAVGLVTFVPLRARRGDVVRVADIAYGDGGAGNLLDVYHHRARPAGSPLLIHLHGGAMRVGKKNREGLTLIYRLASLGWVCISANYRLAPAAVFPDQLIDVKKVIAWAREHAEEYGIDPSMVFVAGGSAGGQLASLAALTQNEPRYQPGFEGADTSIAAAVSLYGLYGTRSIGARGDDRASDAFPISHLNAAAPPFFVAHGDRDSLLSVEGAREFVKKLRTVSTNPVVYAELPGAQHGFDRFRSVRCDNIVNGIERFAACVLAQRD